MGLLVQSVEHRPLPPRVGSLMLVRRMFPDLVRFDRPHTVRYRAHLLDRTRAASLEIWSRRRWMAPSHSPWRRCLSRTPSSSALAFKKSRKLRSDSRPFASGDFREGDVSSFGMTASPSRARLYPDLIIPSRLHACLISLFSLRPVRHGVDSGSVSDTIRPRST